MRYIRTTNNQIEFIEANDEGKILNSIGLQLGEVYFQIKNGKVAFYLNDSEKPFDNFIWSMNLPITIDGEEYEDEDEVSAVLHNIMNDRFQEQLDELREGLAAESARAQEAEEQLDDKIEEETARAISAETHLQTEVTELSGLVSTFDERITRCEETVSALSEDLNDEITRSTAKDAEHDAAISGLTTSLNNEIARAQNAETILHNEILAENTRATAAESALDSKIDNETDRATSAETALNTKIDAEILRSTNKDTQHDNLISALTENLNDEVERAQNAESALTNALNSEIQRAISAETELHDEILAEKNRALAAESGITSNLNAEIQNRIADVDAEEARALAAESALTDALNAEITRSTSKDASHDSEISGLTTSLQNEINRAVGAENSLRNDLNSEISARTSADAAQLQRITALEVGKADKSDLNNYYTKSEINAIESAQDAKINAISGEIITIQDEIDDIDIDNYYTKAESDSKYQLKGDYVTGAQMSAYTYDKQTIDDKIAEGGSFDPSQYYNKTATDALLAQKQNTLIAGTGIAISNNVISATGGSQPADAYTKAESDARFQQKLTAGSGITISNNVISATGGSASDLPLEVGEGLQSVQLKLDVDKNSANGDFSLAGGLSSKTSSDSEASLSWGYSNETKNIGEAAFGIENKSLRTLDENDKLIPSASTVFTVGSHTIAGAINRTNAFDVRFNGDIYVYTDKLNPIKSEKIRLQDYLIDPETVYTKTESDNKYATITNFNSHSGNTDMHVTTAEKATWNAKADASNVYTKTEVNNAISAATSTKQDALTAGDGIDITNNVISTVTKFWCGTQAQYDEITIKDPNTVYMIHE